MQENIFKALLLRCNCELWEDLKCSLSKLRKIVYTLTKVK